MRRVSEKTRGSDDGILNLMLAELSVDIALRAYNAILYVDKYRVSPVDALVLLARGKLSNG